MLSNDDYSHLCFLKFKFNGKCSKISNTFLFLCSNKRLGFSAGIHKMLVRITNREDLIWVCTVCLCLFGRQLVFEILEHLP